LKNLTVRRYEGSLAAQWDAFTGRARNATFLFNRGYMDYHADRFEDFSLIVEDEGEWRAVLPANRKGDRLVSHGGLTYGGLVYGHRMKLAAVLEMMAAILEFLHRQGITSIRWKSLPTIYHTKPSEEAEYALFLADARLVRRDTLSVIDLSLPLKPSTDRKAGQKRGEKAWLHVVKENQTAPFWTELLLPSLAERHETRPVHTADEMQLLMDRFPENIHLYVVYDGSKPVAGTVLYLTDNVVHSQYIAADNDRHQNGSLDLLHFHLLSAFAGKKKWFDFGISNELEGRKLNGGLSYWKESFGAGTVIHDFYEVETARYSQLRSVIL